MKKDEGEKKTQTIRKCKFIGSIELKINKQIVKVS